MRPRLARHPFVALSLGLLLIVLQEAHAFVGNRAPEVTSPVWINAEPQSMAGLRGRVVLVEFWTHGCFNCRNVEPYIKQWHQRYADRGLVVIGVHSPEFAYERSVENVKRYIKEHDIRHAVAIDNDFVTWNRYLNRGWPAIYLIDRHGVLRYMRYGEGGYTQTEQMILSLLTERP